MDTIPEGENSNLQLTAWSDVILALFRNTVLPFETCSRFSIQATCEKIRIKA